MRRWGGFAAAWVLGAGAIALSLGACGKDADDASTPPTPGAAGEETPAWMFREAEPDTVRSPTQARANSTAPTTKPADAMPVPGRIENAATSIGRRTLRGRIVDLRGMSVAAARVVVESHCEGLGAVWPEFGGRSMRVPVSIARSGRDGGFEAEYLEGATVVVTVRGPHSPGGPSRAAVRVEVPRPWDTLGVVVPDREFVEVRGVVRRKSDGAAVAGGQVEAVVAARPGTQASESGTFTAVTARCDASGAFALRLPTAGRHRFTVTAQGCATLSSVAAEVPANGTTLEFDVSAGAPVSGRVVDDASGLPMAGVVVHPWSWLFGGRVGELRTDRDGRFASDALDPRGWNQWIVEAPGYAFVLRDVVPERLGGAAVEVRLQRPGTLVLRCVDAARRPVADAIAVAESRRVASEADGSGHAATWSLAAARSGADGAVRIDGVAPGARTIALDVYIAGVRVLRRTVPGVAAGGTLDLGDIVVDPGRTLEGRVVRADGTPVRGMCVVATPAEPDGRRSALGDAAADPREAWMSETDDRGRFAVQGLAPGRWDVVAWDEERGEPPALRTGLEIPAAGVVAPLELRIPVRAPLTGRLMDGEGRPLAGWNVEAFVSDPMPLHVRIATTTDAEGRFRFERYFSADSVRVWVHVTAPDGWRAARTGDGASGVAARGVGAYVDVRSCPVSLRIDRLGNEGPEPPAPPR